MADIASQQKPHKSINLNPTFSVKPLVYNDG